MRISMATNFDDALPGLARPLGVFELYGKLAADFVGGGRATFMLPKVGRGALHRHVAACRQAGLGFNYLLNASCLDNVEYTRRGQRRIRRLLDWISETGIGAVTITNPFLLRLVKRSYPHLRTRVSVFAAVNDVRRARYWERLGADCIAVDSLQVNREFELLRSIREGVECELELLVSNSCIQNCPLQPYHPNLLSHASQKAHRSRGFVIDWCLLWCSYMKLLDPVNYLRADWIRPEDLHHYEALGYDQIKLTERGAPTELLLLRARAYHQRRYDGNLLDLVQPYSLPGSRRQASRRGRRWAIRHFARLGTIRWRRLPSLLRLARLRGLLEAPPGPPRVNIPNRDLDGFIDRFLGQGCRHVCCEQCRYCHGWARKVVRVDEEWRAECLSLYKVAFEGLEGGSLWHL